MNAKLIMIQGVSANAGKSIVTSALCRHLANQGLRVAPFKPILVCSGSSEENGIPTDTRFLHPLRAAKLKLQSQLNPLQILPRKKDWLGQIMSPAELRFPDCRVVKIPLFGRDTPLFSSLPASLIEMIRYVIIDALTNLRSRFDVVIIEGAGNPTDLDAHDLTNHAIAELFEPKTLLVTKLSTGGGAAALLGTYALLTTAIRRTVAGFVLNDLIGGDELAAKIRKDLEARIRVPCLGILPNLWARQPWADREGEFEGLAALVRECLNLAPLGLSP